MKLVVNTNGIIAAPVKDSISSKILLLDKINLLTIEITSRRSKSIDESCWIRLD